MIAEKKVVYIKCDNCNTELDRSYEQKVDGINLGFIDQYSAECIASEQSWMVLNNKHYCNDCSEENISKDEVCEAIDFNIWDC